FNQHMNRTINRINYKSGNYRDIARSKRLYSYEKTSTEQPQRIPLVLPSIQPTTPVPVPTSHSIQQKNKEPYVYNPIEVAIRPPIEPRPIVLNDDTFTTGMISDLFSWKG